MKKNLSQSNSLLYISGTFSTIVIFILLAIFPILTQYFEYKITDIKYSIRSMLDKEPDINSSIVMINLDDYSKIKSGKSLWPYSDYATVINKITAGEPTSIGIDFIFANAIDTSGWSKIVSALETSFLTINPYMVNFGETKNQLNVIAHQDILSELSMDELPQTDPEILNHVVDIPYKSQQIIMNSSAGIGFINIVPDLDGVLRRLPIIAEMMVSSNM